MIGSFIRRIAIGLMILLTSGGATADVVVDMPPPPKATTKAKATADTYSVNMLDAGTLALRRYTRARTGTYNTYYSLPRLHGSSFNSWNLGPYYQPYFGGGNSSGSGLFFGFGYVPGGVFWNRNVIISGPGFSVTH